MSASLVPPSTPPNLPAILAISSHVAVGHVGNAAASPALERLGFEIWRVDTVKFSNHPGHKEGFTGTVTASDQIEDLLVGIGRLTGWIGCGGIYTGYMGEGRTPSAIARHLDAARAANPDLVVLCDPVIGDHGRVFVRDGVEDGIRDLLLPRADVITPNAFELSRIAGCEVTDLETAASAVQAARTRLRPGGPRIAVGTGIPISKTEIGLVMAWDGASVVIRQSRRDRPFFGTGDLFSGLFLGHLLHTNDPEQAVHRAASGLRVATEVTAAAGSVDLDLIRNLDAIVAAR
jgi:pyridoxine kinase